MGVLLLVIVSATVAAVVWHRRTGGLDDAIEQGREAAARLYPSRPLSRRTLPRRLLRAAAQTVTVGVSGTVLLPTRIEIAVNPADLEPFDEALDWLSRDIADALRQQAAEKGWVVPSGPEVVITADENRQLRVPRAKGRIGALSREDVHTLKSQGPLVRDPEPAAAPRPDANGRDRADAPADAGDARTRADAPAIAADAETRADAGAIAAEARTRAEAPPDAPNRAEAAPREKGRDPRPTPPTGFLAPVAAASAAASAAAAAAEQGQQQEQAVFMRLVATTGTDDLSAVVLSGGVPVVLGRSREAHLQVHDRKASGRHCTFSLDPDDGELHVEDLQSTNGTYVGGRRIERSPLATGDTLGVGTSTWRVELDDLAL